MFIINAILFFFGIGAILALFYVFFVYFIPFVLWAFRQTLDIFHQWGRAFKEGWQEAKDKSLDSE
ncbi:MAG: hypothetical protein JJT76_12855 [Clostridiaceae bacterium]|nr:hypothetical protein [Clostridiaceae bacterium]